MSKETGWLVDLGYRFDEIENNDEFDTFSIGAGKYVLENTAIVLSYAKSDADRGDDADTYGLGVEHLWHLAQGAIKLDASIARVDPENGDDIDVWGLGGTYYVTPKLGFGADYSLADSDETELQNWSLFVKWFVTEQMAPSLVYPEQEGKMLDLDSNAIAFTGV